VSVRRSRIQQHAEDGDALAARLLPILSDPARLDRYIAACQIGITFSSLILGAFAQATLAVAGAAWLEGIGWERAAALSTSATAVLVSMTVLQVVFGELVPKSLALQFPTRTAVLTYLPMAWSLVLFRWFIDLLNGSGLFLVRLLGVKGGSHRHVHSPEEIDMLLVESADGGTLEPEERRRLHDALRLSGRSARELMTPRSRLRMIDADAPFEEIVREAIASPHTRMPVFRGSHQQVIGFIHTRDLAAALAKSKATTLDSVLRPILAVSENAHIHQLLPLLRKRGQRLALVIDEFGSLEGIVTLQDVLDELLGVVSTEHDLPGQAGPQRLPDGRWRLPGLLPLADIGRLLGIEWRDRQVTTIGGFIIKRLPQLPAVGQNLVIDGVHLEIERMDRQMVSSVLLRLPAPEDEATAEAGEEEG
jgi:CBS domain containing-hemolysin-like protein